MSEIVTSPDGLKWVNNGVASDDHLAFGGHEVGLGPILEHLSDPEKAYINVGAHVGTWAIRMAAFNKMVYAFEANPKTYQTLLQNIALNDLFDKVRAYNYPIWNKAGVNINLVDVNNKDTGGSTRIEPAEDSDLVTSTLDSLFVQAPYGIGLISMDVEGAEARILQGAKHVLVEFRPNLLIELHEGHPGTAPNLREQVYAALDLNEYTYNSLHVAGNEEHLVCYPKENVLDLPSN